jgi:hypothetical protein
MTKSISILGTAPQLPRVEIAAKAPSAVTKGKICKLVKTVDDGTDSWTAADLLATDHESPHILFAVATEAAAANEIVKWVVQGVVTISFRDVGGNLAAADTACSVVGGTGMQSVSAASSGERVVAYNVTAVAVSGDTELQVTYFDGTSMVFA